VIEDSAGKSAPAADRVARAGTSYDWLTSADGALHWVESSPEVGRAVRPTTHQIDPQRRTTGLTKGGG